MIDAMDYRLKLDMTDVSHGPTSCEDPLHGWSLRQEQGAASEGSGKD